MPSLFNDNTLPQWKWGIIVATVGYICTVLYSLLNIKAPDTLTSAEYADWHCRLSSILQSFIAVLGCAPFAYNNVFGNRVLHYDSTQNGPEFYHAIFVWYLLIDSLPIMYYYKSMHMSAQMIAHHIMAGISWSLVIKYRIMQWYGAFWLLGEISTPIVNVRWYLDKSNKKDGILYIIVGSAMFVLFFIGRILHLPYTLYVFFWTDMHILLNEKGRVIGLWFIITIIFNAMLQLYWFYLISSGVKKKIFGGNNKKKIK